MDGYYQLTNEILMSLGKLTPKARKEAFGMIGRYEFEHCADDPIYWLDFTKHVKTPQHPLGLPYVYTVDPHILYQCKECEMEVFGDKRGIHLEFKHSLITQTMKEMQSHFKELPSI